MNVISKATLVQATKRHDSAELTAKVHRWFKLAKVNRFDNFMDVKQVFPQTDLVGEKLVFNLGSYRLIVGFSFLRQDFYIKALLTHREYDKGDWK